MDEPPISHGDVTTVMRILSEIKEDVHDILVWLEDDGEQETPEDDG